jgi:hypothetical protein
VAVVTLLPALSQKPNPFAGQEIAGVTGGALDSNEGEPGPIYFQGDHHGGICYRSITIALPKK